MISHIVIAMIFIIISLQPLLHCHCQMLGKLLDKVSLVNHCSYFIKLLLEKKYALPYRVLDATVAHFMRFLEDSRIMPVIWHQSLLAFVQRLVTLIKSTLSCLIGYWDEAFLFPRIICFMESSSLTLCLFGGKDAQKGKKWIYHLFELMKLIMVGALAKMVLSAPSIMGCIFNLPNKKRTNKGRGSLILSWWAFCYGTSSLPLSLS